MKNLSALGSVVRSKLGALLVALAVTVAYLAFPALLYDTAEHYVYDALVSYAPPVVAEERVVIVDIDEASLARYGAWPWPRAQVARLVDTLTGQHQAAMLGLDIVFPLRRDGDDALRAALARPNVVVSQTLDFAPASTNRVGALADPVMLSDRGFAPLAGGYIANDPALLPPQPSVGHISPLIDDDGRIRRLYPLACVDAYCALTLSLRMYAQLVNASHTPVRADYLAHGRTLRLVLDGRETLDLPLDAQRAWVIPYRVARGGFAVVSAADVLDAGKPLPALQNSIVLVGSSALGIGDRVATPLDKLTPGVEVHAQLLAALLDQSFIAPVPVLALPFLALAGLLLLSYLLWPERAGRALVWPVTTLICVSVLLGWLLLARQLWLPLTPLPLMIGVLGLMSMLRQNRVLASRMHNLRSQFSQFLPSSLVGRVMRDAQVGPETELHTMTVLIVDVRGFTAASEGKTPEQIAEFAQKCFEVLSTEVARYRGTIEKYTGDGLMALWGVPTDDSAPGAAKAMPEAALHVSPAGRALRVGLDLAHARYAAQAVSAAIAMQQAVASLSDWFGARGYGQLQLSIGLNTGPMSVGVFGGRTHLAWSAQGQAFNVASRIENLTRDVGHALLLGESTALLLAPDQVQKVGDYAVKGVAEPIAVYALIPRTEPAINQLSNKQIKS